MHRDLKVPWENPSLGYDDLEEIKGLFPYSKNRGGAAVSKFEADLATFVGAEYAIAVNNGSSALVCALLANGVGKGDLVAVPTYTFASVVNSIIIVGATPVLVDSDRETFNMDLGSLEELASRYQLKACIHVDVAGLPPDIEKLDRIGRRYGISIIEDGAESLGTAYKGKNVGSFSHTTTLSFHPAKQMTTLEGGAVITSDKNVAENIIMARNHGMSGTYDHVKFGFNFRMTPFEAAIGISQLKKLGNMIERRRAIAQKYLNGLQSVTYQKVMMPYVTKFSWGAVLILLPSKQERDALLLHMMEKGIEGRVMWKPVHMQTYYETSVDRRHYPNAEYIFDRVLSLPIGNGMPISDTDYVVSTINSFLNKLK